MDEESNEDSDENSLKPVKKFKEDELIEEHSGMSSEDDMQEDDCSSDSGSDSEKTESDKDTDSTKFSSEIYGMEYNICR